MQVVVNPENKKPFSLAEKIRSEFVLKISGKVNERPEDAENEDLTTGDIRVERNKTGVGSYGDKTYEHIQRSRYKH